MKRRRGFTLMETLIVCTLTTAAVALGCQTLVLLYRTDENVRHDARLIQTVARLGREFRNDAHQAIAAEVGDECRLTLNDGRTIVYSAARDAVVRRVEQDGKSVARESFAAPRGAATFSRRETDGRVTVGLELKPAGESPLGRGARPWSVNSTLGLHTLAVKEAAE